MGKSILTKIVILFCLVIVSSCSIKKRQQLVKSSIVTDSLLNTAFVGFKLVDLDNNEILVDYNSDKFFVPASNTKLLTMYGALKTFGDSIPGWFIAEDNQHIFIEPNGDPTFLHSDFKEQKLFDKLRTTEKKVILILPQRNNLNRFGTGWPWASYRENYSVERSVMPMYANLVRFVKNVDGFRAEPSFFTDSIRNLQEDVSKEQFTAVSRDEQSNSFTFRKGETANSWTTGYTGQRNNELPYLLLKDTLSKVNPTVEVTLANERPTGVLFKEFYTVPTDELLGIMMKRSDNFLAEQILIMVGKTKAGVVSDYLTIQDLRGSLFDGILEGSRWADGSGLSRSNLISPSEFIELLETMYREGNTDRVWEILPSGNQGTLKGLYTGYERNISAKTGTLSDHLGLSGYLKTNKNRKLAFSFLINNHRGSANDYRKKIEEILVSYIEDK